MTLERPWYVVETHPRAERLAQNHLERQRFHSFCPRFRKARRHARRIDEIVAPVFPGYLFVSFDRDRDNWSAINGTRGIRRLVGAAPSHPQAMPPAAMRALLERCDGDLIASLCPSLTLGQQVRLIAGPFAEILAEIERFDDRGRVRVLLDMLGARSTLAVHVSDLAPA